MELAEIFEMWEKDCVIKAENLTQTSMDTAVMHCKYLRYLSRERLELHDFQAEREVLKLEKYIVYDEGPSKENKKKYEKWTGKLPAKGAATSKKELDLYLEADSDLIVKNKELAIHREKVNVLDDIIEQIKKREFLMNIIIKEKTYQRGG